MWKLFSDQEEWEWIKEVAVTETCVFLTTINRVLVTDLCGNRLRVWQKNFGTIHAIAAAWNVVFVSADGAIEAFRSDGTYLRRIAEHVCHDCLSAICDHVSPTCLSYFSLCISVSNKLFAAATFNIIEVFSFDGTAVFDFPCKGHVLTQRDCDGELFAMEPTHTGCTIHVHATEDGMSLRVFTLDTCPWSPYCIGIARQGNVVIAQSYSHTCWTMKLDGSTQQEHTKQGHRESGSCSFDVEAFVSALLQ